MMRVLQRRAYVPSVLPVALFGDGGVARYRRVVAAAVSTVLSAKSASLGCSRHESAQLVVEENSTEYARLLLEAQSSPCLTQSSSCCYGEKVVCGLFIRILYQYILRMRAV